MLPKIIDLTSVTPYIPMGYVLQIRLATESEDDIFKIQSMSMNWRIGTHIDAPAHCINGAAAIDDISWINSWPKDIWLTYRIAVAQIIA